MGKWGQNNWLELNPRKTARLLMGRGEHMAAVIHTPLVEGQFSLESPDAPGFLAEAEHQSIFEEPLLPPPVD